MKIYVPPQGILTEAAMYEELSAGYSRNLAKSSILTRQQMIDDLLPKLNKLFEIEYNRYTEQNEKAV
jgi:hypothetical protein